MYEKHKEKHCFSRVSEGLDAQVGVTWAQKSRPRGVRTVKNCLGGASQRGQDSQSGPRQVDLSVGLTEVIANYLDIESNRTSELSKRPVI